MRRIFVPVLVAFLALGPVGCGGGGGGNLTADEIATKLTDRVVNLEDVSCTETTEEGSDLQSFSCNGRNTGATSSSGVANPTYVVVEASDDVYQVTGLADDGATIIDAFTLD